MLTLSIISWKLNIISKIKKNEFNENLSIFLCLRDCSYIHRIKAFIRDIKRHFFN